ncbi:hypothetical protein [Actinomadura xylanilytica]|uniref:hypothetical protein n=1 Tax=Actinomadura xylanilytica TaxID=887459 RepID=UPI00255A80E4|nr:hypothetical protein [Actinomadura xylanilytica]MDL4775195.1 hypothetical protein [Actinomadura xylanilytica]
MASQQFHMELVARVEPEEEFARLAVAWMQAARRVLFPRFDDELQRGPVLNAAALKDDTGLVPRGEPNGIWAAMQVHKDLYSSPSPLRLYSPTSWQRFVDALACRSYGAWLFMEPLDAAGRSASGSIRIGVSYADEDFPEWMRVEVMSEFTQIVPADEQRAWASFIKPWATGMQACWGHITDDFADPETSHEDATGQSVYETIPKCSEALRGYSWVTIVAPELMQALGGAQAIRNTCAFTQVDELSHGGGFLQATDNLEEYGGESVQNVFRALAPVLLPGRTVNVFHQHPWDG